MSTDNPPPRADGAPLSATATGVEHHPFDAEVGRLLELVARSLYSNRDIFLRELVSNASDACERLRWEALTRPALLADTPELAITIEVLPQERTLVIRDSGIGMSREELISNLGSIARSGSERFLASLQSEDTKAEALPEMIGRFGVGFYSALMVAERIVVETRRADEEQAWRWESSGGDSYTLTPLEEPRARGTEIRLSLREEALTYLEPDRIESVVRTWCDHIQFPVSLGGTRINREGALWRRARSEISPEQYEEFYHHISHNLDVPWRHLHFSVEGLVGFTALLYFPSLHPHDLYDPERATHVRLYVRSVFVAEQDHELIPSWLRFLRGVVDSDGLSLNVSREMLQQGAEVERLREALTKRVLRELESVAKAEPEHFADFWSTFGAVVKEGLYEDAMFRDRLLHLARFRTTAEGVEWTSLAAYVERMGEGSDSIWYLSGEDAEQLALHPRLEGLRERGEEVLLLTDAVDEFWTSLIGEFEGKPLRSVRRAEGTTSEDAKDAEKSDEQATALVAFLSEALADRVHSVRTASALAQSPACLAAAEGDMDFHLEHLLRQNHKLNESPLRILEINPSHPLICGLEMRLATGATDEVRMHGETLLELARVAEYGAPANPARFAAAVSDLMTLAVSSGEAAADGAGGADEETA